MVGKVTLIQHCMFGGTVLGCLMQQGNIFRFLALSAFVSFRMSFSARSDIDFYEDVSIAAGRKCIDRTFHPVRKMSLIHLSIRDVATSRAPVRLSTIPIPAGVQSFSMQICEEVIPLQKMPVR